MDVRLIVIRTADPKKLSEFYTLLGLTFEYHRHGNSPMHYSAQIGLLVFEIYPFAKNQMEADKSLRLGFAVDRFEETLIQLNAGGISYSDPLTAEFGTIAIITDPDGRKVELYKQ